MMINQTTFLGQLALQTAHAIPLFERVLSDSKVEQIFELGTGVGGLSLYFKLWSNMNKATLWTYDQKDIVPTHIKGILSDSLKRIDLWTAIPAIGEQIKNGGKTLVFCDNGDKPKEYAALVPFLKVGDIIGAHDWDNEIKDADVAAINELYQLEEWRKEINDSTLTNIKVFIKKPREASNGTVDNDC